eukprot:gb/GECG01009377.1/.p1 GENE.gb/GECG01009377.1/~~gb/GECG01009377.1/.p1  ORF type:complete len:127 (+),score=23.60 gb/GECG01009377.1/:1-381(+)
MYKQAASKAELSPLHFWRTYGDQLPLLAGAAKLLLPFPASSAPAERTFSAAGLTQHRYRKSLQASTLKDLLTLKHVYLGWLDGERNAPEPIDQQVIDCEAATISEGGQTNEDAASSLEDDEILEIA